MVKIAFTSDRAQTVDGLGVFLEDEERVFTVDEVDRWIVMRGVPFHPDDLPEGLSVAFVAGGDE